MNFAPMLLCPYTEPQVVVRAEEARTARRREEFTLQFRRTFFFPSSPLQLAITAAHARLFSQETAGTNISPCPHKHGETIPLDHIPVGNLPLSACADPQDVTYRTDFMPLEIQISKSEWKTDLTIRHSWSQGSALE